ncbi:MAG: aminoglycoside phosphotransferase family protein [Gammaproteobacteria bacterium]|nr:aminoglycoside phosphotransferase family protein [Gammaproteobacteria bacterium]
MPVIDESLVRKLIASQFPLWKDLMIQSVKSSGWDNRTFHLGDKMLVRMPSNFDYAHQVEKEHQWLPKLVPFLPLPIPSPVALGKPTADYPMPWSVYRWIEGETASTSRIDNVDDFAKSLAEFLVALQRIDTTGGPLPGLHSFYRGGLLSTYDEQTRKAIEVLKDKIDRKAAVSIWETALTTQWNKSPVWVHGDISLGNLLVKNGKLCAVIDFGQLVIGDPACDLAIAWTFFKETAREIFQKTLSLDVDTWARGRGWVLWKALIVAAGFTNPTNSESKQCWNIIDEIISDDRRNSA